MPEEHLPTKYPSLLFLINPGVWSLNQGASERDTLTPNSNSPQELVDCIETSIMQSLRLLAQAHPRMLLQENTPEDAVQAMGSELLIGWDELIFLPNFLYRLTLILSRISLAMKSVPMANHNQGIDSKDFNDSTTGKVSHLMALNEI